MPRTPLLVPLAVGLAFGACVPTRPHSSGPRPAAAADSGPAAVARRHLRADLAQDWATSAALTDPGELARTKAAFLPLFERDSTGRLAARLLGLPPGQRPATLPDADFTARLYGFVMRAGLWGTTSRARFTDAEVLAVAVPSPDTAYVVYRWVPAPGARAVRTAQVVQLQRVGGRWRLHMLADFEPWREVLAAM